MFMKRGHPYPHSEHILPVANRIDGFDRDNLGESPDY